jgi:hypothetical protein
VADEIATDPQATVVNASDIFMRWVHTNYAELDDDGTLKKLKPGVFSMKLTDTEGFSVFMERLMTERACAVKARSKTAPYVGIVKLKATDFSEFEIGLNQVTEDDEIAHFEVVGYQGLTDDDLTNIKREWAKRAKPTFKNLDSLIGADIATGASTN